MAKRTLIGKGKNCPKCGKPMSRYKHPPEFVPKGEFFFEQWDTCRPCKHVQLYEEFKCFKFVPETLFQ
jgi:hypothetical protein